MDRVSLERLAQHRQQVPLPLTAQERIRHIPEMVPARSLGIIAPTGGEPMQMGMILPMTPMRVEHGNGATPECLASDGALEVIQTLCPTAYERAQHDCRIVVKGRAEHRGDRQDDVPIDDALVEDLAYLTDPVVDVHFGAA
jgi:hypothetical protein